MRSLALLLVALLAADLHGFPRRDVPAIDSGVASFERTAVPDQAELRARIASLKESSASDAASSIRELEQAIAFLDEADAEAKSIEAIRAEIADMPRQFASAEQELAAVEGEVALIESALARDSDADAETLQSRVEQAQAALATARRQLSQARIGELRRIERASRLAEAIDNSRDAYLAAVDRARGLLESDPSMQKASTVLAVASEARAAARRAALRVLPERIVATAELEALRLRIAEERNAIAEMAWRSWSELLFKRLSARSDDSIARASTALAALGAMPPAVEAVAAENRSLIAQARRLREGTTRRLDRTGDLFRRADTLERLLSVEMQQLVLGGTGSIGEPLRRELAALGQIEALDRELAQLRRDGLSLYLLEIELGQKLAALQSISKEAAKRVADSATPIEQPAEAQAAIESLLEARRDLLVRPLMAEVRQQLTAIDEQAQAVTALSDAVERLRLFLLENLLDLRTGPALGPAALGAIARIGEAVPERAAATIWHAILASQSERPAGWILSMLLLGAAVVFRRRVKRRLVETGERIRRIATDRFVFTLEAAGLTLLLAAPLPIGVLLLGTALAEGAGIDPFLLVLGDALVRLSMPVGVIAIAASTAMKGGLGEAHFRWAAATTARLRRGSLLLLACVPPLHVVSILLLVGLGVRNSSASETLSRLCLVACGLAIAATAAWIFLAPRPLRSPTERRGVLARVAIVAAIGAPLVMSGMAWLGYSIAAQQVLTLLYRSAWIAIAAVLLRDLLIRWLSAASRRIAREQLERRRHESAAAAGGSAPDSDLAQLGEDPEVDLAKVNAQAYRVIQSVFVTGTALALGLAWSGLLPALSGLDQVVLWETMTEVASTAGEGTVNVLQPVSILDVLGALLAVLLTVVLTRDIPGLLQLLVLPRLPVSAGVGYAITSFTRYGIGVVGVLVAFGMIGLRWNQVQWLASAAVLGLSFGLQEIFSNFVSGVLMLVEQPVRVGDVVTVNGVTGRVTRIQIRATTITDWDRRELVIPNKSFITGQFSNWTLSDNRTRQIVEIGVAYGSDYRLVERLLLAAAAGDPDLATDPAPSVVLKSFADSSVVFDLRFVVEDVSKISTSTHRVKLRLAELFAEHGVEIPFPQRDLHLRSVDPEAMKALKPA